MLGDRGSETQFQVAKKYFLQRAALQELIIIMKGIYRAGNKVQNVGRTTKNCGGQPTLFSIGCPPQFLVVRPKMRTK